MVTRNRFSESDTADGPEEGAGGSKRPKSSAGDAWAAMRKAWSSVGKRIPEMRDDLSCYAAVQVDRARLAVSQVVTRIVFGVLLMIAAGAVVAIAAYLLIVGIAGGVAAALDGNVWLANLITGLAVFALLFGAITMAVVVSRRNRLRRLQVRYARHVARQRAMAAAGVPEVVPSSEAEYLAVQATDAEARFRQTAHTLGEELLAPFEIRPFIQRRPWWSLGGAAAAGFVSGLGIGGRGKRAEAAARGRIPRLLAIVGHRLRRVVTNAIGAVVVANLRGGKASPASPPSNGRRAPPAAKTP